MKEFLKKKWVRTAGTVLACILIVYIMIYVDVVMRARSAYLEGEKYWRWAQNPEEKKVALTNEYNREKAVLEKKYSKKKIEKSEYEQQLEILKFNLDERIRESSIKYAYIWYQTAVELFSPPESKWVRLSRTKMVEAKEAWKKELRENNIPFEDYMLE